MQLLFRTPVDIEAPPLYRGSKVILLGNQKGLKR